MIDEHLEELDAYVQVAVLGAYADGSLANEERQVIRQCVEAHAVDQDSARVMASLIDRLPERERPLTKSERKRRVEEVRAVLTRRDQRERAFVLAVDVANAKEGIGVRESSVLLQLMFDLEIDGDFARRIVEETSRGTRGNQPLAVTQPDVAQTLRSGEEPSAASHDWVATLQSPTDHARENEARSAVTLPMEDRWDDGAKTERRPPAFASISTEPEVAAS